jgi:hypothetical protein
MKVQLIPKSSYLAQKWWHRLALVLLWAWPLFLALFAYRLFIDMPYTNCVVIQMQARWLPCGSGPFDYFGSQMRNASPGEFVFGAVVAGVLLLAPSAVYRVFLYVAKGSSWRGPAPDA